MDCKDCMNYKYFNNVSKTDSKQSNRIRNIEDPNLYVELLLLYPTF